MRVFPATLQRGRSRHSIRYIRESHAVHKRYGSIFYRTGIIAELLHCWNRELRCDLDLDQMTFIYELGHYFLEMIAADQK